MQIAVAGSSGLGPVIGLSADPSALLSALATEPAGHVVVLAPRHLERRAREQTHVAVAGERTRPAGVLVLDHHPLTLTLIAATVLQLRDDPVLGWSNAGQGIQLVRQSAARSRSIVWHPRALGLRRPAPTAPQALTSLVRAGGYVAELGADSGLTRGGAGLAPDGAEELYVAGEVPALLARQLGDRHPAVVQLDTDPDAPYRTGRAVELCGLAGPAWAALPQRDCAVCGTSRPPTGCLFCGTGADTKSTLVTAGS